MIEIKIVIFIPFDIIKIKWLYLFHVILSISMSIPVHNDRNQNCYIYSIRYYKNQMVIFFELIL